MNISFVFWPLQTQHPRLVLLLLSVLFVTQVNAQAGSLDQSFANAGKLELAIDTFGEEVHAMVIQPDEKILMGGYTQSSFTSADFLLLRYHPDGTPDASFGNGGKVVTQIEVRSQGKAMALQSDGKILLAGYSKHLFTLARYHSDGSLDTTFGAGGKVLTPVDGYYGEQCRAIAVQPDGKIVLGGDAQHFSNDNSHLVLTRYLTDGSLDTTFGTGGVVIGGEGYGNTMALQSDGKIVLAGTYSFSFTAERFNPDGSPDLTFGTNGKVVTSFGNSSFGHAVVIQNDGKIVLTGYRLNGGINNNGFALARYNTDGSLDNTFGSGGQTSAQAGTSSEGNAAVLQSDGKILVAGMADNGNLPSNFSLARFNTDGSLDNTFGTNGTLITPFGNNRSDVNALSLKTNGKIVAAGYLISNNRKNIAAAQYHNDGTVGFGETCCQNEISIFPNPMKNNATIHSKQPLQNASLTIYNTQGQLVNREEGLNGQQIYINRNQLPAGIYFLQLTENQKVRARETLVVQDH